MDANELKSKWMAARKAVQALQDEGAALARKGIKVTAEQQAAFKAAVAERDALRAEYNKAASVTP